MTSTSLGGIAWKASPIVRALAVCLACHQEIPNRSLAVSFLHHVAKYTTGQPATPEAHSSLLRTKILLPIAWIQLCAALGTPLAAAAAAIWYWRRRRKTRS